MFAAKREKMSSSLTDEVQYFAKRLGTLGSSFRDRTSLVTGGAGFLGSWICDVVNAFDGRVICVDNLKSGSQKNFAHLLGRKNFRYVKADVQTLTVDEDVDYVFHMACPASPPVYQKYPIETLDTSVLGTRNILEISKKGRVKAIVFTSTSETYGDASIIPTPEAYWGNVNPVGPRSVYDEGKRVAETYCRSYFQKFQVPVRIARIFNTYGPRLDVTSTSQYGRVVVKFIVQALAGKPLTVYGDGTHTRSFCYITDLIEGLFKLLLVPGIDGEIINLGGEQEISIIDLAETIVKLVGSNSGIVFKQLPRDDPRRRRPDTRKAEKLLDWKPRTPLNEGLIKTINWISKCTPMMKSS